MQPSTNKELKFKIKGLIVSVTISLYKPTKKLLPVNVHADINDTGGDGPLGQSEEDFEFVANPDADPMERDLQKKIILYQNRRSQADIEKAKKIRSMLGLVVFTRLNPYNSIL